MDAARFGRQMVEVLPRMIRGFARYESNYLSKGKITFPQLWVLEHLSRKEEGLPMNELARFLSVSRPAVTGLVDRLIAQGLVQREDDARDRRVVRVRITAKGQKIVTNIWEQKRRMITEVFGKISPRDRSEYLSIVQKVVHILSEKDLGKK